MTHMILVHNIVTVEFALGLQVTVISVLYTYGAVIKYQGVGVEAHDQIDSTILYPSWTCKNILEPQVKYFVEPQHLIFVIDFITSVILSWIY